MARNDILVDAPPDAVFEVLEDPAAYPHWVVGSRGFLSSDGDFPAPGAAFRVTVGIPPLVTRGRTSVLAVRPPRTIELLARARPLPDARVTIHVDAEGDGARVTIVEEPSNRLLARLITPIGHAAIRLRNAESLRRLKKLAEAPV